MPVLSSPPSDAEAIRRRVASELYQRLAFTSFAIWTLGCFVLFIILAAGNPRPTVPTMISMTVPLVPAILVWALYRPLVRWRVARQLATTSTARD